MLLAAAVVVCGAVMTILDTTIVNIAIDRLGVVFDARLSTIQWVSTGYLLALAAVIPLTGWAVDRYGTRTVFLSAVTLFLGGSVLCGIAWSAGILIFFRVLQGLGGGMVMPVGMTILARAAGQERMGRVMALVGIPMLLAPALGPALGGALVDGASWRLIFFINVPIGIFALALASRVLPREEARVDSRLDWVGALLLSPGFALVVLGISSSAGHGLPALAGLLLIAAFVRHALRTPEPLIDLRIFADRVVAAAAATTFLFGAAFFGSLLLMALYFQLARDESALHTGIWLVPQGDRRDVHHAGRGQADRQDRRGLDRARGYRRGGARDDPVRAGRRRRARAGCWPAGLFLRGAGMGATLMPAMAAAYQVLPPAAVARAASALEIVQRTGASLGIALLAVVLQHGIPGGSDAERGRGPLPHRPGRARAPALLRRRRRLRVGAGADRIDLPARGAAAAPRPGARARAGYGLSSTLALNASPGS